MSGHAFWLDECTCDVLYVDEQTVPPYLDQFVIIYLEDIVVYNNSMEEHV